VNGRGFDRLANAPVALGLAGPGVVVIFVVAVAVIAVVGLFLSVADAVEAGDGVFQRLVVIRHDQLELLRSLERREGALALEPQRDAADQAQELFGSGVCEVPASLPAVVTALSRPATRRSLSTSKPDE